jgi:hypothetical protein
MSDGALFPSLAQGLAAFKAELQGDAGAKIAAMPETDNPLRGLILTVLKAVLDALVWLETALVKLAELAVLTDGMIATLETAGITLKGMGGLRTQDFPPELSAVVEPLSQATGLASQAGDLLAGFTNKLGVLPTPDDINLARAELEQILGRTQAPLLGDRPRDLQRLVAALPA